MPPPKAWRHSYFCNVKYQIGDRVLILHSDEEAEVVDIINDQMILVDVMGVSFPVYMDQVDFPYYKRFTEQRQLPAQKEKQFIDNVKKEKKESHIKIEDGVWLTFLPVMEQETLNDEELLIKEFKIHVVNNTGISYHFIYALHFFGKPDFELKNTLHPFEDFYLHDIAFEDLNDNPSFEFEFHLVDPDKTKEDYIDRVIRLKPKQIFAQLKTLKEKSSATFSQRLFEKYPDRKFEEIIEVSDRLKSGAKIYNAGEGRQHLEQALSVIDLHIEKLTDAYSGMSNFEMLSLQLKFFEKYYLLAVLHRQPSLIVIHGIGEGKLKEEIHNLLRKKAENIRFSNDYHPRYGFGATEINFQY